MLDLHLVEQDVAVFGDLDVTGSGHQHLHGPLGSEVGLENILDAFGSGNVDGQGLSRTGVLGLRVQYRDGRHLWSSSANEITNNVISRLL